MKYRGKDNQMIKTVFLLLLLAVGIGYAYLTSNLSITGSTAVIGNTWDIHFDNVQISSGSVTATTPAIINPSDNTKINYVVLLNRPGEYYEFTVDMVNAGTLPGKVTLVELNGINPGLENVIDYSIVYTNNNNPVAADDILNGGATKKIKVRVYYKEDINEEDLLTSNVDLAITLNIVFNQSEEDETIINTIIQQLKTENSSCFTKYEGQVTDQVGQTVTAQNVYFNKCANKRNIIFNNMCFQMIRTTETGGIKMIYNGEVVNGKCESSRGDHKGIVQSNYQSQNIASSYLYGSSFTYDTSTNEFTLLDTTTATWSDSTYENLLGKFTCKSSSDTCTTIYQINGYVSNTNAYLSYYTITDTNYAQIGTSSFNANYYSPAMVGYMFNNVYNYKTKSPGTNTYKYGSAFTYANGTYILSGTTQDISDWSTGYNTINNTHYTCWDTSGTCSTISYIYYTSSSTAYYFDMSEGKGVNDILEEMLSSNDVNRYNSSIKGIIDAWYSQNLSTKTSMLEDTVYCNARNITSLGGWNPNGGSTTSNYYLKFKNYNSTTNLACPNETDQFAVGNSKAKLTYPVALLEDEERYNINTSSLMSTGAIWWGLSPYAFNDFHADVRRVFNDGSGSGYVIVGSAIGLRFVVSLNSGTVITGGDGSEESPWVVE